MATQEVATPPTDCHQDNNSSDQDGGVNLKAAEAYAASILTDCVGARPTTEEEIQVLANMEDRLSAVETENTMTEISEISKAEAENTQQITTTTPAPKHHPKAGNAGHCGSGKNKGGNSGGGGNHCGAKGGNTIDVCCPLCIGATSYIEKRRAEIAASQAKVKDANDPKSPVKAKRKEDKAIDHILRALSSLHTTEEKLAALCKKYADLLEDHRNVQNSQKQVQRKLTLAMREKDQLQTDYNKAVMAKSKLESLCRELQKHNKQIKEESLARARDDEERRREVHTKFQTTIGEIQTQMADNHDNHMRLKQENFELAEKLKKLLEKYETQEQHVKKLMQQRELEGQLHDVKLQQAQMMLQEEKEYNKKEKDLLILRTNEAHKQTELHEAQEKQLRTQLEMYTEKYEEFQSTLNKSNEVFGKFKSEMDRMAKRIKKLEKETLMWRGKWEGSQKSLIEMAEDKQRNDRERLTLKNKNDKLESLCRALQAERSGKQATPPPTDIKRTSPPPGETKRTTPPPQLDAKRNTPSPTDAKRMSPSLTDAKRSSKACTSSTHAKRSSPTLADGRRTPPPLVAPTPIVAAPPVQSEMVRPPTTADVVDNTSLVAPKREVQRDSPDSITPAKTPPNTPNIISRSSPETVQGAAGQNRHTTMSTNRCSQPTVTTVIEDSSGAARVDDVLVNVSASGGDLQLCEVVAALDTHLSNTSEVGDGDGCVFVPYVADGTDVHTDRHTDDVNGHTYAFPSADGCVDECLTTDGYTDALTQEYDDADSDGSTDGDITEIIREYMGSDGKMVCEVIKYADGDDETVEYQNTYNEDVNGQTDEIMVNMAKGDCHLKTKEVQNVSDVSTEKVDPHLRYTEGFASAVDAPDSTDKQQGDHEQ